MKSSTPYFLDLRVRPHKTPNPTSGEPHVHAAKLCFLEQYSDEQEIAAAVAVAQNADTSIIFAGRSAEYESEGYDMLHIKLPINQVEMIKAVAATSQRSVLILHCANPIDVQDFVDDVDAIICAHFLGQEGGSALADILYGNSCPSGKLAVTWPKCLEDAPSFPYYPAKKTNRGWEISCGEGLGVGYRHDWTTNPSQWPFGFGLSYTTFRISSLSVSRVSANCQGGEAQLNIKALLTNTGLVAGAEVVQMYVEDVVSSVSRPVRELKGFTKVFLEPQTSEVIEISCKERHAFSFWNEQTLTWTAEAGEFRIHVGDCVASIHLSETLSWRGL
jgi:beta-glucosidase